MSVDTVAELATYQDSRQLEISNFRQSRMRSACTEMVWVDFTERLFGSNPNSNFFLFFKTKCALEALLERLRLEAWLVLFMWDKDRGDF